MIKLANDTHHSFVSTYTFTYLIERNKKVCHENIPSLITWGEWTPQEKKIIDFCLVLQLSFNFATLHAIPSLSLKSIGK